MSLNTCLKYLTNVAYSPDTSKVQGLLGFMLGKGAHERVPGLDSYDRER